MSSEFPEPEPVISLQPDQFKLDVPYHQETFAELVLTNITDEIVAFKVKTTAPDRYFLRPTTDYIDPQSSKTCKIAVVKMTEPLTNIKDKFLVQSTVVSEKYSDLPKYWKELESMHRPKEGKFAYRENRIRVKLTFTSMMNTLQEKSTNHSISTSETAATRGGLSPSNSAMSSASYKSEPSVTMEDTNSAYAEHPNEVVLQEDYIPKSSTSTAPNVTTHDKTPSTVKQEPHESGKQTSASFSPSTRGVSNITQPKGATNSEVPPEQVDNLLQYVADVTFELKKLNDSHRELQEKYEQLLEFKEGSEEEESKQTKILQANIKLLKEKLAAVQADAEAHGSELKQQKEQSSKQEKDIQDKDKLIKELKESLSAALANKDKASTSTSSSSSSSTSSSDSSSSNLSNVAPASALSSANTPSLANKPKKNEMWLYFLIVLVSFVLGRILS